MSFAIHAFAESFSLFSDVSNGSSNRTNSNATVPRPLGNQMVVKEPLASTVFKCCCYALVFHYATLVEINEKTYCANRIVRDLLKSQENFRTYLICDFILVTGIPIATTTILYIVIGVKMCTRVTPGNQTAANAARNRTVNRKVISMLVAVLIAFCICWMPTWVALACLNVPPPRMCHNDDFAYIRYFLPTQTVQ